MELSLSYRRYRLALRHPVRTSAGTWIEREGIFVRIVRPDGSAGYGEAAPIPAFGTETLDAAEAALGSLGARTTTGALAALPQELASLRQAVGSALALRVAPVHRSLAVAALLPAGRPALDWARSRADTGFRTFKWKVGVGPADDEMAILDDLIGTLPAGSRVRLDANGAWDLRTAGRWLTRASDRPVEFVEQPVAADSRGADDALLGLAADHPVPVALDESLSSGGDVVRGLNAGWRGYFIVKPSLLGDPVEILGKLAVAGSAVVFSSALETGIGARRALDLAFSWPGAPAALGFGVWPLFQDASFDGPAAAPFFRPEDLERINPEALWNAAS
jgi:O-succinylbenzoate synthase